LAWALPIGLRGPPVASQQRVAPTTIAGKDRHINPTPIFRRGSL
jgi:hypothetical protein